MATHLFWLLIGEDGYPEEEMATCRRRWATQKTEMADILISGWCILKMVVRMSDPFDLISVDLDLIRSKSD